MARMASLIARSRSGQTKVGAVAGIIARHVAGQAGGDLGVFDLSISKYFPTKRGERWLILDKFGAGVHCPAIIR